MNGSLTEREKQVLAQVGLGLTNNEIAAELFLSLSTVKGCLHEACVKLGARNRAEAAIAAMKQGLLDIREVFSIDELVSLVVSLGPETTKKIYDVLNAKLEHSLISSNNLPGADLLKKGGKRASK